MMDIHAEKIALVKLLLSTDNPKVLSSVRKIFQQEKVEDFWDELTDEQKNEIEAATLEIERGEVVDYEKFMAEHR
jgi:hypothetical protein